VTSAFMPHYLCEAKQPHALRPADTASKDPHDPKEP